MKDTQKILKAFRMTEKTNLLSSDGNCYVFEVDVAASKQQIAAAVRDTFGVRPVSVRTLLQKGKLKRHRSSARGGTVILRKQLLRKAFVSLRSGEKIEVL
jgi:large subunit ribosomal protein L23